LPACAFIMKRRDALENSIHIPPNLSVI